MIRLLRTVLSLVVQFINSAHELTWAYVQSFTEFQQVEVARIALAAHERIDLLDADTALISDRLLGHSGVFGDEQFDRLTERALPWTKRVGLSCWWHEREPARSSPDGVRKFVGYHACRRLSAVQFAGNSISARQPQLRALGRILRTTREEHDLSAQQLASKASIPLWKLTATEEGRLDPEFDMLTKLADALPIGLGEIFTKAEEFEKEAGRD